MNQYNTTLFTMERTNTKPINNLEPRSHAIMKIITLKGSLMSLFIKELKLATRYKPRLLLFFLK
jgi:hypothetical protein